MTKKKVIEARRKKAAERIENGGISKYEKKQIKRSTNLKFKKNENN